MSILDSEFRARFWTTEEPRHDDPRDDYQRDRARIIHSSGFRRLQGKTQVMGVGEGDFHRTRLTHSIEVAHLGEGILSHLQKLYSSKTEIFNWLPSNDLVTGSCFAHDLGHPPYGHGGEQALHGKMLGAGGFEGNGQTLRILMRLEKYRLHQGINPTRRLVLAVLKYPIPFSEFPSGKYQAKPPKCYLDTEKDIVGWALEPFKHGEREIFTKAVDKKGKPTHRTLDSTLMECADDIAYGVHDLEDIVARKLLPSKAEVINILQGAFSQVGGEIRYASGNDTIKPSDFDEQLFKGDSFARKRFIGKLVNFFISSTSIEDYKEFNHPLLRYRVVFSEDAEILLTALKRLTYDFVISKPEVQQLEKRGQRIVAQLFDEFMAYPEAVIPKESWNSLGTADSTHRKVCDYIAGMTDSFAEKIYRRLFIPGFGSSSDEI